MSTQVVDPEAFRRLFPALTGSIHLASCSLGARSTALDHALGQMLAAMAQHGAPWPMFEAQHALARRRFAALVGADVDQVAVLPSVSVAAAQVVSTLTWWRRPRLITSHAEFPGVYRAWMAQRMRGAEVVVVGDSTGRVQPTQILAAIDDRTALVSIPAVTFRDGVRLPVAALTTAAHKAGARVFVDASQAVGVEPVDVAMLRCDFLATGVSKYLLGLPGVAFLYARHADAGDRPPQLTSWLARTDPFSMGGDPYVDAAEDARRFEVGSPAVPALYAANAGLGLIAQLDLHQVRRHVTDLFSYAVDQLADMGERLRLPADAAARGAHVALIDPAPVALARWLSQRQVAIAPRGDVARLALHLYNTRSDIDAACVEIRRYRRRTGTDRMPAMALAGGRHA